MSQTCYLEEVREDKTRFLVWGFWTILQWYAFQYSSQPHRKSREDITKVY